jgi:hypothetical protein
VDANIRVISLDLVHLDVELPLDVLEVKLLAQHLKLRPKMSALLTSIQNPIQKARNSSRIQPVPKRRRYDPRSSAMWPSKGSQGW